MAPSFFKATRKCKNCDRLLGREQAGDSHPSCTKPKIQRIIKRGFKGPVATATFYGRLGFIRGMR